MNSAIIVVETRIPPKELVSQLRECTVSEFDMIRQKPEAIYCGEVTSQSFAIRHVRYGPMSHAPFIHGEFMEGVNDRTVVKMKIDIKEPYEVVRKMYFSTLLPIGLIIMLFSLLFMWGTEFQWHSLMLSGSFIVVALLVVALEQVTLRSMKKNELAALIARIGGRVVGDSE